MSCLPFTEAERLDPFGHLEARAPRMANAILATSRRRDVRERRSQLVLLLMAMACPVGRRPLKSWYVPGGVARNGAEGIRRAWDGFWGEEPPSLRTVRSYLGELEAAAVLVRSPGDWLPMMRDPEHPERRPRYPDSFHLLRSDASAEWWSGPGRLLLERNPGARCNPDTWRALFQGWRSRAENGQLELVALIAAGEPRPAAPTRGIGSRGKVDGAQAAAQTEDAATIAAAVRARRGPMALLLTLAATGCRLEGGNAAKLVATPELLEGAALLLARALRRGDRIRNRAGWLVRMAKNAPRAELFGRKHAPPAPSGSRPTR